ncbi:MAG: superoxide dismutase [Nanoarchaeota archaeon]
MVHTLPKLPYSYNSLEPYFDEETMALHHTKHHQAYINKLNAALEKHPQLQNKPVEELIKNPNSVPEDIRTAVRNHGGGHFNHSFWWPMLKKDTKFSGEIAEAINKKFGSFEKFKEEFSNVALSLFGSGWTWLVLNNSKLEIVQTPNQDCPLSHGKIPVLGIDMWEHSFYKKRGPDKAGYIEDFFNVINWEKVNENYKKAK